MGSFIEWFNWEIQKIWDANLLGKMLVISLLLFCLAFGALLGVVFVALVEEMIK